MDSPVRQSQPRCGIVSSQPITDRPAWKSSDLYGWRGQDPRLRYLSPWEFTALWEVQRLQPPLQQKSDLSEWLPGCGAGPEPADGWQFERDYRWKQHILADNSKHIVPLPSRASTAAGADHYFVRRAVPLVPYPTSCPLPKADMNKDQQARLLNIYLRPWTLAGDDATFACAAHSGIGHAYIRSPKEAFPSVLSEKLRWGAAVTTVHGTTTFATTSCRPMPPAPFPISWQLQSVRRTTSKKHTSRQARSRTGKSTQAGLT